MSKALRSVVLASTVGFLSAGAYAENGSGFYVGASFGAIKLPSDNEVKFSNPKNGAIDFGYAFSENWAVEGQISQSLTKGTFSIDDTEDLTSEIRANLVSSGYTATQASSVVKSATLAMTAKLDASIDSYGIFGVYRSSGALYFKAKAGLVSVKTKIDAGASSASVKVVNSLNATTNYSASELGLNLSDFNNSGSETETKFSVGVGAGYKFSDKLSAEIEYTQLTTDLDLFTVGIKYAF